MGKVIITVRSPNMDADKLREFVEQHLNLESKALRHGKLIKVTITTENQP